MKVFSRQIKTTYIKDIQYININSSENNLIVENLFNNIIADTEDNKYILSLTNNRVLVGDKYTTTYWYFTYYEEEIAL